MRELLAGACAERETFAANWSLCEKVNDELEAENNSLRAALIEAVDGWEAWASFRAGARLNQSDDLARIAHLRAKAVKL